MKNLLNYIVNAVLALLARFHLDSANRIAIALSPLFVSAAGFIAALVAKNIPGAPNLDAGEITGIFIAGATLAAGKLLLWLHGWQKHEARIPDVVKGPPGPQGVTGAAGPRGVGEPGPQGPPGKNADANQVADLVLARLAQVASHDLLAGPA